MILKYDINIDNNIIPKTIIKEIQDSITIVNPDTGEVVNETIDKKTFKQMSKVERNKLIEQLENEMRKKAKELNFEEAMFIRDTIFELKSED